MTEREGFKRDSRGIQEGFKRDSRGIQEGFKRDSLGSGPAVCTIIKLGCPTLRIIGRWKLWRRVRDSNPRYPLRYAGFQDRCHQPLGQLSGYYSFTTVSTLGLMQRELRKRE